MDWNRLFDLTQLVSFDQPDNSGAINVKIDGPGLEEE